MHRGRRVVGDDGGHQDGEQLREQHAGARREKKGADEQEQGRRERENEKKQKKHKEKPDI